jgi:hypothetical protein
MGEISILLLVAKESDLPSPLAGRGLPISPLPLGERVWVRGKENEETQS